jgi:hypothetical protein
MCSILTGLSALYAWARPDMAGEAKHYCPITARNRRRRRIGTGVLRFEGRGGTILAFYRAP